MRFAYINGKVIETVEEANGVKEEISMSMIDADGDDFETLKHQLDEVEELIESGELTEITLEELEMARRFDNE